MVKIWVALLSIEWVCADVELSATRSLVPFLLNIKGALNDRMNERMFWAIAEVCRVCYLSR